jgi:hypothetical protein
MKSQNPAKTHLVEKKELVCSVVARVTKKRGPQNEGKSHDVIENKWWKNVSLCVFHNVVENK